MSESKNQLSIMLYLNISYADNYELFLTLSLL